jgi:membrane-bound ClpP family serine protease
MLFLFRGHNGPAVRCIAGALLLVAGIAVHGGAILAGVGVVLLVWGAIGALSSVRAHHHGQAGNNGRMS